MGKGEHLIPPYPVFYKVDVPLLSPLRLHIINYQKKKKEMQDIPWQPDLSFHLKENKSPQHVTST